MGISMTVCSSVTGELIESHVESMGLYDGGCEQDEYGGRSAGPCSSSIFGWRSDDALCQQKLGYPYGQTSCL